MADNAEPSAVREWAPDDASQRRPRRRVLLFGAAVVVGYGAALVVTAAGLLRTTVLVAASAAFIVAAARVRERQPTARGPAADRPPAKTDARTVPPPSPHDFPRGRRDRQIRTTTCAVLVASSLWAASSGPSSALWAGIIGTLGLRADLPWLWRVARFGRRPLARTEVTVRAVGAPAKGRVVLATDTMAWSAARVGALHDVVVGDVLVADLDRRGVPFVLTFERRRSVDHELLQMPYEQFRAVTGVELGPAAGATAS